MKKNLYRNPVSPVMVILNLVFFEFLTNGQGSNFQSFFESEKVCIHDWFLGSSDVSFFKMFRITNDVEKIGVAPIDESDET
jgi:hypothetical protein